jgi:hypothetical protein
MSTDFFFGYGSLVNRATHAHDPAFAAQISGWGRVWRHLPGRRVATLSVEPVAGGVIDGLIAGVAAEHWAALDRREAAYDRHPVTDAVTHTIGHQGPSVAGIQMYVVPPPDQGPEVPLPILRSYLDVVVQGYLQVFGEQGVVDFFATTRGWQAPVLDDRTAPVYPRHQLLSSSETALVDAHLAALAAQVEQGQ